MDADRLFFKLNAFFCFYLGLSFLSRAYAQLQSGVTRKGALENVDLLLDLLLRNLSQQSFLLAVFAGYIPALMLISMVVSFYLYLHERSRAVALIAFIFGIGMGVLWISRRYFGSVVSTVADKYELLSSAHPPHEALNGFKDLYYYDSVGSLLSDRASLMAYALFGVLFMKGQGLEYIVGVLFLASSFTLLAYEFVTPASTVLEAAGIFVFPALAFIMAGCLLWKYEPTVEEWAQPTRRVINVEEA